MPSDFSGIAPAGGTPPPSDDGSGTPPIVPQQPNPTRQENGLAELLQSFRTELVDMRREFRNRLRPEAAAGSTPAPAASGNAAPAPQMDQFAFRDAIEEIRESGITVTVGQRKMLERLYRAESGVVDTVSWIREQMELGWRNAAAPSVPAAPVSVPAAPAVPAKPPTTPAPTGTNAGNPAMPDDPALLTESQIAAMTPAEALAFYQRHRERSGGFRHPWAAARDAQRQQGQELQAASAALRAVMAGKK